MELVENCNFLMCYNSLDGIEEHFFNHIMQLIINYPIDWMNFLENILKNKLLISFQNTALIVSIDLLTPQLRNSFNHVYQCMVDCGVIVKTIKTKGFLIIYVYSQKVSDFFQKSGFWLEYLTAYACWEIGFNPYRGVLLKTIDNNIQEVDVLLDFERVIFFIECKDTHNYSEKDFQKIANLRKKVNCSSYGIFVCSKLGYDLNYQKYDLDLIKYKYDYQSLKKQLKQLVTNKILSLTF